MSPATTAAASTIPRSPTRAAPSCARRAASTRSVEKRERDGDAVQLEELHADPREEDLHGEGGETDPRQRSQAAGHEGERERDVHADRDHDPGREHDDEPRDLVPDLVSVRRAEHALHELRADDGERADCSTDDHERDPRRGDDVTRNGLRGELHARQRDGRDEADRERRDAGESRGREVRVAEAGHRARPEASGERDRHDVRQLQRQRDRGRSREDPESPVEPLAGRPHCGPRHRGPLRSPRERDQRHEQTDERGDGHAPRHGDDPVRIGAGDDVHEAGRASQGIAQGRRAVVVERRERARDETGEQVRDPRENDPAERVGAGITCDVRAVAREHAGERFGSEQRDEEQRPADDRQRDRVSRHRAREAPFLSRARQRREHRDANGLRSRHDDDEDGVRGEEPVRLVGVPELARDEHSHERGEAAHDERVTSPSGPPSRASPGRAGLYACSPTRKRTDHAERHSLDRRRTRRPPLGARRRLRRPYGARHRRGRLHGVPSHGRARRARRDRPRVRPSDLERRAEQHRAPPRPPQGPLRRPHGPHVGRLPHARAEGLGAGPAVPLPPRRAGARRRVLAPAVRDSGGERPRHAQPAPVGRRHRVSSSRSSTPPARRRSTGTSASRSRSTTTSTRRAASSSTSARRSIRSRSMRPRRSQPTS